MAKAIRPGDRFGRLVVKAKTRSMFWQCACDCGGTVVAYASNLRSGNTSSCGCYKRDVTSARATHGQSRPGRTTPEYMVWAAMVQRCTNASCKSYAQYGAKGVTLHESWLTFEAFFADMGARPFPGATIDRIDGRKGYEPGNVRWASRASQNRNRSSVYVVSIDGEEMTATDASLRLGFDRRHIAAMVRTGRPLPDGVVLLRKGGLL